MTHKEFKFCFENYFDAIRNYIYYRSGDAELASDIAQDAFMKLWEKQKLFVKGKTKSLLYKIAGDILISHVRKMNNQRTFLEGVKFAFSSPDDDNNIDYTELKEYYEKALGKLTENQRTVFLMNRMEGLTYKEIATCLDISVKAIEKRMSKAIAELKKNIKI